MVDGVITNYKDLKIKTVITYCTKYIYNRKSTSIFTGFMLYIPVNSYGHVGTLPPLYETFSQNSDVMTSKKVLQIELSK